MSRAEPARHISPRRRFLDSYLEVRCLPWPNRLRAGPLWWLWLRDNPEHHVHGDGGKEGTVERGVSAAVGKVKVVLAWKYPKRRPEV